MTHRELYPDQYAHLLVGKQVRYSTGERVLSGRVERVVPSRFGLLAIFEGDPVHAYPVGKCEVAE